MKNKKTVDNNVVFLTKVLNYTTEGDVVFLAEGKNHTIEGEWTVDENRTEVASRIIFKPNSISQIKGVVFYRYTQNDQGIIVPKPYENPDCLWMCSGATVNVSGVMHLGAGLNVEGIKDTITLVGDGMLTFSE